MPSPTGSRMQLFFRAAKLADLDTFSKSDPYCVLSSISSAHPNVHPHELGRTETIQNNLNPEFQKCIEVTFLFETKQEFTLSLYDDDGHGRSDDLGSVTFQLSHVVTARKHTKEFKLSKGGTVTVTGVEFCGNARDVASIEFHGTNMKKMDTFGSSDPYFILRRRLPSGQTHDLYKSEVCKNTLDPHWAVTPAIKISDLTGANAQDRTLDFCCYDSDMFTDDSMGHFLTSFGELTAHFNDKKEFVLAKDEKPGKLYGNVWVKNVASHRFPTFAEYLESGWQISLAVSIDFTGSNGDPRRPTSLHFMDPRQPNQYVSAIMSVGDILMEYDLDKQVPVFGFGASIRGQTHHFFHVNQQPNPYVQGVQGILDAYSAFLPTCVLSGPTNFAPTIISATAGARETMQNKCYTVLLIITDGEITDMDQTIDAVIAADDAPLSIVIIGVGNGCDFQAMDQLDSDNGCLRGTNGRVSRRDLVQFVPFRSYMNAPRETLAAEVLKEIPFQLERFAELVKVKP